MALLDDGRIVGSVTGGCVEPDVLEHARQVLDGGPARLADYGIADEDAFAVGMPCGGRIEIVIEPAEPAVIGRIADAVRDDRPVAYVTVLSGPGFGTRRAVAPGADPSDPLVAAALDVLARGATAVAEVGEDRVLINSLAPRPAMYVFGAIDHAAAVAEIGRRCAALLRGEHAGHRSAHVHARPHRRDPAVRAAHRRHGRRRSHPGIGPLATGCECHGRATHQQGGRRIARGHLAARRSRDERMRR